MATSPFISFRPVEPSSAFLEHGPKTYKKNSKKRGEQCLITSEVCLPEKENVEVWVAVHAIYFYNEASMFWSVMAADPFLETFKPGEGFPDGIEYRINDMDTSCDSPVPAPIYINKILTWIMNQMQDKSKFPDTDDKECALRAVRTEKFTILCSQIFKRLFRVYAIIYFTFYKRFKDFEMAPHLNCSFKHFIRFCTEFGLLPEKEMYPIESIVKPIIKQHIAASGSSDYY